MRYEEIKQLIDLFEETDLAEMELTRENDGLRLVRGNGGKAASQQVLPVQPEIPEAPSLSDLQDIVASVQNGAREAMAGGSAPAVEAVGGTIKEVLVQDGDFVEFGQPLFRIG